MIDKAWAWRRQTARCGWGLLALASAGCGVPAPAVAPAAEAASRWVLVTQAEWSHHEALAARVAAVAGVSVPQARALGPRMFLIHLACADTAACSRATARLRAEPGFAVSIEADERQRVPDTPPKSTAR